VLDNARANHDYNNDNDDQGGNINNEQCLGRLQLHHDELYFDNNDHYYNDNDNDGDVHVDDIPRMEIRGAEAYHGA